MTSRTEIPAKLYFRIGEAAAVVGVEPRAAVLGDGVPINPAEEVGAGAAGVLAPRGATLVRIKELL